MAHTIHPDMTDAYLERALHLPQGSFAEGLGNDPALEHLAKIIQTFPWMVEVAERNFDPIYAKQAVILEGARVAVQRLEQGRNPTSPTGSAA